MLQEEIMADTNTRETGQPHDLPALKAELHRYRQIISSMPDAMSLVGTDYVYLLVNDAFVQRINKRISDVEGRHVAETSGEEVFQTVLKEKLDRCFAGETVHFQAWLTYERIGRRYMYITYVPFRDEAGHIVGALATARDVTDLYATEEALQRSERQATALLNAIPDLIFSLSREGTYLQYKAARVDMHYQGEEPLLGLSLWDTTPPEFAGMVLDQIAHTLDTGEITEFEFDLSTPKGNRHWEARMVPSGEDQVTCIVRDVTEQQQAAQALRESDQQFRQLTENISEVFWLRDLASDQLIYVSPAYEKVWGMPAAELLKNARHFLEAVHPEDVARVQTAVAQQNETNLFNEIFRIKRPDGEIRWMHSRTFPVCDEKGVMYRLAGVATDITLLQQTEEALRTAADIMNAMPDGLFIYQYQEPDKLYLIDANPTAETLTGINLKAWAGKEFNDIWPEAKRRGITDAFLEVIRTGKTLELDDLYYKDERITDFFRLRAFLMPGNRLGVAFDDITAIKLAEEAEQEQRLLATTLVETAQAINQTLDYDAVLRLVLQSIDKLVPHDGANLMLLDADGQAVRVVAYCDCYARNNLPAPLLDIPWQLSDYPHLQEMVERERPLLIHDTRTHPTWVVDGRPLPIHSYLGVPLHLEGKVIGLLNLDSKTPHFYDEKSVVSAELFAHQAATAVRNAQLYKSVQEQLQQLQETQHRLVQSEKLAAIGELVAGVAHELNNPLSGIILYAQLLQLRQGDKDSKDVAQIVTQAHRAAAIVRGLLDFARQRPPEKSSVNCNSLLEGILDFLAYELRTHNITVSLQLDPNLPLVVADLHQMQQVFLNLITNALQAMDVNGKGTLWINSSLGRLPDLNHHTAYTPAVQIMIRDDGPGIAAELQSRIFDPFFTTKPIGQGTGLGLSVCHGIISEHGGEIWVESEPGQGAAFFVTLPVGDAPVATAVARQTKPKVPPNTDQARILLIDDEESILDVLGSVLHPHQVDRASQGELALQQLAKQEYDVILCDVHMPGMGGIEFYLTLQEKFPHLADRVIFMTGDTVSVYTNAYMQEIQAVTLAKPFDVSTVLAAVEKMLSDQ